MQDPNDRRCVIIQPLSHRNSEVIQLFKPLRDSLSQLFKKYNEEELSLILDILVQLNLLFSTETMNLKSTE
jgi:DNA-binding MarR family transcriptional regulator